MPKINGKKLTYHQRLMMSKIGIKDCKDWVYIKTETVDSNGSKHASKNGDKKIYTIVQNRVTGEIKRL